MLVTPVGRSNPIAAFRSDAMICGPEPLRIRLAPRPRSRRARNVSRFSIDLMATAQTRSQRPRARDRLRHAGDEIAGLVRGLGRPARPRFRPGRPARRVANPGSRLAPWSPSVFGACEGTVALIKRRWRCPYGYPRAVAAEGEKAPSGAGEKAILMSFRSVGWFVLDEGPGNRRRRR